LFVGVNFIRVLGNHANIQMKHQQQNFLHYNRANSEKAIGLSRPQQPINIVTATYLDPRRYYKFVHVWLYLIALFGAQIVQYRWLVNLGEKWKQRLSEWVHKARNLDSIYSHKYKWFTFKEDYAPESTQNLLSNYATMMESGEGRIPPLEVMGASYVDSRIPNVVFEDSDHSNNTVNTIATRMVSMLNDGGLVDTDYQLNEARNVPIWKSRFIIAPDECKCFIIITIHGSNTSI
jgi:hypothetical protein